jgi:hypothetical protein
MSFSKPTNGLSRGGEVAAKVAVVGRPVYSLRALRHLVPHDSVSILIWMIRRNEMTMSKTLFDFERSKSIIPATYRHMHNECRGCSFGRRSCVTESETGLCLEQSRCCHDIPEKADPSHVLRRLPPDAPALGVTE